MGNILLSLRSKRFRLVSEQRNTEEGDFRFCRARNETRAKKWKRGEGEGKEVSFVSPHPLPALLLAPLFSRSLTLVPRSFLLNRTETLATQAIFSSICVHVNLHILHSLIHQLLNTLYTLHCTENYSCTRRPCLLEFYSVQIKAILLNLVIFFLLQD